MHKIINPQQIRLFDPFSGILTERTHKCMLDGWEGVFRHVILELMPVDAIYEPQHYSICRRQVFVQSIPLIL
jgi:hypothetical protein